MWWKEDECGRKTDNIWDGLGPIPALALSHIAPGHLGVPFRTKDQ